MTQTEIVAVVGFALFFAGFSLLPELASFLAYKDRWSPVPAPPSMLGDGYHYFSLLRKLDDRLVKGKSFEAGSPLPQIAYTQILGLLANWIPYATFRAFKGRKAGIVAVRFCNRTATALLSMLLAREVSLFLGADFPVWYLIIFFLSVFMLSPLGSRTSVLFNLANERHFFNRENHNDMTRAYVTETTSPILLGATLLGLQSAYSENMLFVYSVAIFATIFMSFVYTPALVAHLLFSGAIYFGNGMVGPGIALAIIGSLGLLISGRILRHDPMSSSLIAKEVGFRKAFSTIKGIFPTTFFAISTFQLVVFLPLAFRGKEFILDLLPIFVALLLPVFFSLFIRTFLGRIWVRGWEPVWATITISVLACQVPLQADFLPALGFVLFLCLSAALIFYFLLQAIFTLRFQALALEQEKFAELSSLHKDKRGLIVTDDPEIALFLNLYSEEISALENYSVQKFHYRAHIGNFVACLKSAGWSKQRVIDGLTSTVSYGDWIEARPIPVTDPKYSLAQAHTLQFWATNREYNVALHEDGMYDPENGWTGKFKELLEKAWDSNGNLSERP